MRSTALALFFAASELAALAALGNLACERRQAPAQRPERPGTIQAFVDDNVIAHGYRETVLAHQTVPVEGSRVLSLGDVAAVHGVTDAKCSDGHQHLTRTARGYARKSTKSGPTP